MKRTLVLAMVLVSSIVSSSAFAAPIPPAGGTPVYGKVQSVKFTMRNDSEAELKLSAGAEQLTLAPGQSLVVKLPLGEKIVASEACGHYAQGELISTVADLMNGNTLSIH